MSSWAAGREDGLAEGAARHRGRLRPAGARLRGHRRGSGPRRRGGRGDDGAHDHDRRELGRSLRDARRAARGDPAAALTRRCCAARARPSASTSPVRGTGSLHGPAASRARSTRRDRSSACRRAAPSTAPPEHRTDAVGLDQRPIGWLSAAPNPRRGDVGRVGDRGRRASSDRPRQARSARRAARARSPRAAAARLEAAGTARRRSTGRTSRRRRTAGRGARGRAARRPVSSTSSPRARSSGGADGGVLPGALRELPEARLRGMAELLDRA